MPQSPTTDLTKELPGKDAAHTRTTASTHFRQNSQTYLTWVTKSFSYFSAKTYVVGTQKRRGF